MPALVLWSLLGTQRISTESLILVELFILSFLAAKELKPQKNGGRSLALGVVFLNHLVATVFGFFLDHLLLILVALVGSAGPLVLLWYWKQLPRKVLTLTWIGIGLCIVVPPGLSVLAGQAAGGARESSQINDYHAASENLRTLCHLNTWTGRSPTERVLTRFRLAEALARTGNSVESEQILLECDQATRRLPVEDEKNEGKRRLSLPWLLLNASIPALRSRIYEAKSWNRPIQADEVFLPGARVSPLDGLTWSLPIVDLSTAEAHATPGAASGGE